MNPNSIFDLYEYDGATVLVRSSLDTHEPPVAVRGTVDVRRSSPADPTPVLKLVLEFPELFTRPAHRREIPLNPEDIDRLLASEHDGVFEFTVPEALDPAA